MSISMDCQKLDETLYELVSGSVDDVTRGACESHAAGCARCSTELSEYRETVRLMAVTKMPEMPEGFWDRQRMRVMEVVHRALAMRPWKAPPLSLAALLVLVGLYAIVGIDGFTGMGSNASIPEGATNTFALTLVPLYVGLLALAIYSFREKAAPTRPNRS